MKKNTSVRSYERHVDDIYRLCFSYLKNTHDCEDAVSVVFCRLMQKNSVFESLEQEKGWLIVTACNECKSMLRQKKRHPKVDISDISEQSESFEYERCEMLEAIVSLDGKYSSVLYCIIIWDIHLRTLLSLQSRMCPLYAHGYFTARKSLQQLLEVITMKEIREAMEMISPSEEQKNRMFEKAEMMAEKSYAPAKRKGRVIKIACCTAAAAAIIGTTTVFADDIKSVFYGLFGNESIISEDIIENVYEDTDGHIDFSVSKVVSDRINSYAIVKYTALDDEGAKWLDKAFTKEVFYEENRDAHYDSDGNIVTHSNDMLDLTITPKGYDGHYVSYSYGLTNDDEITHESEENARVFKSQVQCGGYCFRYRCN